MKMWFILLLKTEVHPEDENKEKFLFFKNLEMTAICKLLI